MKLLKLISIVSFVVALSACAQLQELTGYKTYDIHFTSGSAAISAEGQAAIAKAAMRAKKSDVYSVRLIGYTDASGDSKANQALSEKRVNAVKKALVQKGLSASNIKEVAYGERFSSGDNNKTDRRVEINLKASNRNNWAVRHPTYHSNF